MIGDSAKTIVTIIVVAIILAAATPLIVGGRADGMTLRARDIGPGWQENQRSSHDYTGNTTYGSFVESVIMSNETSIISSTLFVFNSSVSIIDHFPGLVLNPNQLSYFPIKAVDIGDRGLIYGGFQTGVLVSIINGQTYYANGPNIIILIFMKGNVVSMITLAVKGIDTPPQSWINDFIMEIGLIQLQKIVRYSSS